MKKLFLILLIFTLFLTSCDPAVYHFDADEIIQGATKIELLEFQNDNPVDVKVDENTVLSFDRSKAIFIKELDKSQFEAFANDLSSIIFHQENESVTAPIGYTVLIHLDNEEIIVISCTVLDIGYSMVARFKADGTFLEHIATFADEPRWRRVLEKYFNV